MQFWPGVIFYSWLVAALLLTKISMAIWKHRGGKHCFIVSVVWRWFFHWDLVAVVGAVLKISSRGLIPILPRSLKSCWMHPWEVPGMIHRTLTATILLRCRLVCVNSTETFSDGIYLALMSYYRGNHITLLPLLNTRRLTCCHYLARVKKLDAWLAWSVIFQLWSKGVIFQQQSSLQILIRGFNLLIYPWSRDLSPLILQGLLALTFSFQS